jgi:hypothetical protein
MTTLREAREKGKLEEFIAEREAEAKHARGDRKAFDKTVSAMGGKSKPVPGTSKKDERDG